MLASTALGTLSGDTSRTQPFPFLISPPRAQTLTARQNNAPSGFRSCSVAFLLAYAVPNLCSQNAKSSTSSPAHPAVPSAIRTTGHFHNPSTPTPFSTHRQHLNPSHLRASLVRCIVSRTIPLIKSLKSRLVAAIHPLSRPRQSF
jgi:hypothetical protein